MGVVGIHSFAVNTTLLTFSQPKALRDRTLRKRWAPALFRILLALPYLVWREPGPLVSFRETDAPVRT